MNVAYFRLTSTVVIPCLFCELLRFYLRNSVSKVWYLRHDWVVKGGRINQTADVAQKFHRTSYEKKVKKSRDSSVFGVT